VFEGNTAVDVCVAHVTKPPTPPSEVAIQPIDPGLEAIILKCLAKQPADRYATALELRSALLALPAGTDWSVAQARLWWSERQDIEQVVGEASDGTTLTMPVDLQHHRETFRVGA
jgi:eukaryotic-like serine/threonine-protein kinase